MGISAAPRAKGDGAFGARAILADLMARCGWELLLFYKAMAKIFLIQNIKSKCRPVCSEKSDIDNSHGFSI